VHVAHHPFGQMPYIIVSPPSISYTHCISFVWRARCLTTWLSSKTTVSSCTSRAPSADTSRRSDPARS
jgi:hypothetical protein